MSPFWKAGVISILEKWFEEQNDDLPPYIHKTFKRAGGHNKVNHGLLNTRPYMSYFRVHF